MRLTKLAVTRTGTGTKSSNRFALGGRSHPATALARISERDNLCSAQQSE